MAGPAALAPLPALQLALSEAGGDVATGLRVVARWLRGLGDPPRGSAVVPLVDALLEVQDAAGCALRAHVAVADADGVCALDGAVSTASWLTARAGLHPARGHRLVRQARRLHTDPRRPLPATSAAWAAGTISTGAVEAIVTATSTAPVQVVPLLEAAMLAHADQVPPAELAAAARTTVTRLREQAGDLPTVAELAQARCLDLATTIDGWVKVDGFLEPDTGAWLRTVLDTLAAPVTTHAPDGTTIADPRTATQRRADAITTMARLLANHDDMPSIAGAKPLLQVIIDTTTTPDPISTEPADDPNLGLDNTGGDGGGGAGGSSAPAGTTLDGTPIPAAVVEELACEAVIDWALVRADLRPVTRRQQAVLTAARAAHGLGLAEGTSTPVGAFIAAFATAVRAHTGHRHLLDLGRTSRGTTPALRRAIDLRDRHCVAPGCRIPAKWCHVHHLIPWHLGGRTDLTNLVLLCPAHHRFLHRHGWTLTRDPDGTLHYQPPHPLTPHGRAPPPTAA